MVCVLHVSAKWDLVQNAFLALVCSEEIEQTRERKVRERKGKGRERRVTLNHTSNGAWEIGILPIRAMRCCAGPSPQARASPMDSSLFLPSFSSLPASPIVGVKHTRSVCCSNVAQPPQAPLDEQRTPTSQPPWMLLHNTAIGAFKMSLTGLLCCGVVTFSPPLDGDAWRMHLADNINTTRMLTMDGNVAHASGLLQMPPVRLVNRYYLVRAGESEFETRGVINTNPVAKTSIDSGLSEEGKKQTIQAAKNLRALGACDGSCWIWPSITQRAYQTAEIIAYASSISRSRIVPEYSFLDARGLGAYEGRELAAANEVYDIDALSPDLRPPPYTDGTPNESVADVFVRVTQLMSILETQYFGDTIVIVSPDSDNLSVLEAGLTGLDLRRHRQLAYAPGEVRSVDPRRIPAPRPAFSGYFKCTAKPPGC